MTQTLLVGPLAPGWGEVQYAVNGILIPGAGGQSEKLRTGLDLKRAANKAWRAAVAAFL